MDLTTLSEHDEVNLIVGFFDLRGFAKWSEDQNARDLFNLAAELFKRTSFHIDKAGGHLIKSIGDAGLFIFPMDNPDLVLTELQNMQQDVDVWLNQQGYPEIMSIKIQVGPVAPGYIGLKGEMRFDVYGKTVNHAAMMKGWPLAISTQFHDQLSTENQSKFHQIDNGEMVCGASL
jgi:class 3 adenylate cyclase